MSARGKEIGGGSRHRYATVLVETSADSDTLRTTHGRDNALGWSENLGGYVHTISHA